MQRWKPEVTHAWTNLSKFFTRRRKRVSGSEWFANVTARLHSAISTLTM